MSSTNKKSGIIIIFAFIAFLISPHIGALLGVRGEGENLENKALKQFPLLSLDTFLSPSLGEELNDYVWDHLPLRTQLIKADHWIDYYIFKDSPVPNDVLLGRDGWLFLYPSVMSWPQKNAENVQHFVRIIQKATRLQKKTGVKILIVPSHSKASIYPEFLTDRHRDNYTNYASIFQNHLENAATINSSTLLLLWNSFRQEKKRLLHNRKFCNKTEESTCYLFRPRDRHFDWETAILQAKKIIERVAPGKWQDNVYDQYLTPHEYKQSEMERRFIRIDLPEPYIDLMLQEYLASNSLHYKIIPVERTKGNLEMFRVGDQPRIQLVKKRVVVIHDSFFEKSKYFVAPYFEETIFMHWSLSKNFSYFMETVSTADILIIQGVDDSWYVTTRLKRLHLIFNELKRMKSS